ncbi:MAG: transcriptional regulator, partial [Planococcus donghaensis]
MSNEFERAVFLDNEYFKALKEIEQEINKSSDRGIVLICGSVLDGLLGELLKGFLVDGNKKEEDLFKGKGILATFDGKIILSFYLGLINKNEFDNLKLLQKIRNI